ncbi:MAG: hypothetical protein WBR28_05895 [Mycobacterium sp.]
MPDTTVGNPRAGFPIAPEYPSARPQGYELHSTDPNALSQVSQLLLEL